MLKKFISSALLSVAVDKKARNKIKALKEKKRSLGEQAEDSSLVSTRSVSDKPSVPLSIEYLSQSANARKLSLPGQIDNPKALIDDILTSTGQELERKALIEQAMAIRRSKLHILDELDREQLNKLTEMAIQALNVRIQK